MIIGVKIVTPRNTNKQHDEYIYRSHSIIKLGIGPTLMIACVLMFPLVAEALHTLNLSQTARPYPSLFRSHQPRENGNNIIRYITPFCLKTHSRCVNLSVLRSSPPQDEHPETANETPVSDTTTQHAEKELTPQEKIQQALGTQSETENDRKARIAAREALIAKSEKEKLVKIGVAVASGLAAVLNYAYQYTHPITSLSLLTEMQRNSDDITVIGRNGKPTVVDFWAPWCENCKASAPTLSAIEAEYKSQVNFILVNGDLSENWDLIERFGVDAIPHLALLESDGTVDTALIGPIPRSIIKADLDVLLSNAEEGMNDDGTFEKEKLKLPHVMYDAFQKKPELKKIRFDD